MVFPDFSHTTILLPSSNAAGAQGGLGGRSAGSGRALVTSMRAGEVWNSIAKKGRCVVI